MSMGFGGIFGRQKNPYGIPEFETREAVPAGNAMPIGIDQINRPKKSFFGQGGPGRAIAGTIGDFLLQQSGMDPIYMPNVLQQRDAEERARMAQQQRMQGREEFLFRENYKRQNPEPQQPDQLTQYMINAGIDPKSPEAQGMYRRAVQNKVDPPVWRTGPDGRYYRMDTAPDMSPVTDDEWGSAIPMGGTGSNVGGGFR